MKTPVNLKKEIFVSNYDLQTHLIDSLDDYYHSHSFYEIFYVVSGEIEHYLNGVVQTLKMGDVFFLRPQDIHCFLRTSGNLATHRDIMIPERQWKKVCDYLDENLYNILNLPTMPFSCHISIDQIYSLENAINEILAPSYNEVQTRLQINSLCVRLLDLYISTLGENNKQYPALINQLLAKMHMPDNFKLGLPKILSFFPYTQNYLCRIFKKYIGITMTDYLNNVRLNYAILLLQTRTLSFAQIAEECGFNNISYFNRIFKERYNMTPSEFKKNCNKSSIPNL